MAELVVIVRFAGRIVDDRCLRVRAPVRIGDAPGAVVAFPGAELLVSLDGDQLRVTRPGGRAPGFTLAPGQGERLRFGRVDVTLVHRARLRLPSEWAGTWDPRFLAMTLLVVAAGAWAEAARSWAARAAGPLPGPAGWVQPRVGPGPLPVVAQVSAATSAAPPRGDAGPAATDGPVHRPDPGEAGAAWAAWLRRERPAASALDADARLRATPDDSTALRVLARAAYDREDWATAEAVYAHIVALHPGDADARLRQARALERGGRHRDEIDALRAILDARPAHAEARAALAVALARVGRFDESAAALAALDPTPEADWAQAAVAALHGQDTLALDSLDRLLAARRALTPEAQAELRRDLAIDPAFAGLRRDRRLHLLLHRHLGAAAPRLPR